MDATGQDELLAWVEGVASRDRRAIGRAMTAVENGEPSAGRLLRALFERGREAEVTGITGAPGAGKSTLVEKLAAECRRAGHQVGIVAVDPTSPFSGGAMLGDRVRMQSVATDEGIYIRSMATRGELGGLAPATHDVVTIFEAAGCDQVIVETVGVGQDEVEVARLADATVLVLAPGMGDDIQTFKAGVMEIADVFVVNKADCSQAARLEQELTAMLSISLNADGWRPPIVRTVATTGEGVGNLRRAISDFMAFGGRTGSKRDRRFAKWRARLLSLLRQRLYERVRDNLSDGAVNDWVNQVADRRSDPHAVVEEIVRSSARS